MLFPLEYLGVYIHAHLAFFPDSDITRYWQIVAFAVAIGNAISVEGYYYFIVPRLNKKKLSNRAKILVAIDGLFDICSPDTGLFHIQNLLDKFHFPNLHSSIFKVIMFSFGGSVFPVCVILHFLSAG